MQFEGVRLRCGQSQFEEGSLVSRRTIRSSRVRSATMVSAGALAVALNVAPSTMAIADAIHRSGGDGAAALPGPNGAVSAGLGGDRGSRGEKGEKGERGHQGAQGPQGPPGAQARIETYVVTGAVVTNGTSTATCATGDEVTGGGFVLFGTPASIGSSVPFIIGENLEGWQASTGLTGTGAVQAYAVCTPDSA
ncbi:hypothetical protein ACFYZJ_17180 [Streptomyces sp. NPDC001848]|uniref:hypothetical protein n=1 Tax=Streptomyces sp. NPDC001848 TaxID=3364618 RepID=UPI0036B1B7E0